MALIILTIGLYLLSFSSSSQLSYAQIGASTISAAPALLPSPSSSSSSSLPPSSSPSPALSPDITPLFPSPSGGELSPSESSLPTIPSSPSPPNPDDITSFGPNTMALSPSGSLPVSSSVSWSSRVGNAGVSMVVAVSLGAFLSFHLLV